MHIHLAAPSESNIYIYIYIINRIQPNGRGDTTQNTPHDTSHPLLPMERVRDKVALAHVFAPSRVRRAHEQGPQNLYTFTYVCFTAKM